MLRLGPMSHTSSMKCAFLNNHVQSHLKPAHAVVKAWKVLVPLCRVV
jgi:hypothetical protein